MLSWTTPLDAAPTAAPAGLGAGGELGYETSLRARVADGLELRGDASHEPLVLGSGPAADAGFDLESQPLWVTDGNAALTRARFALVESRGETRTSLELAAGQMAGRLAPLLPFGAGFVVAADHDLRYHDVRVGLAVPSRGTDVSLAYQWISSSASSRSQEDEAARHESMELRVIQELQRMRVPGEWRLLLALRLGSTESTSFDEWQDDGGDEQILAALDRRVGAGLSVLF